MSKSFRKSAFCRRDALKLGLAGAVGLVWGKSPLAQARAAGGAPAKSVIQIWMWGGPSHLDTFDPKPDAGYDYCGPLDKAIGTNVDGIRLNAALPLLAKQADKYAIIRGMTHGVNAHETASYLVQTGRQPGRLVYPCAGAVVSLFKGAGVGYAGPVPPYIVLTKPQGRFSEAGFLGSRFKPFATGGDPAKTPFAVEGIVSEKVSDERQRSRRELLGKLDTFGSAFEAHPGLEHFDACREEAFAMMHGEARTIFDLSRETDKMRERYGRSTFGQSCLMARRLVEQGVPYVTINYGGWDTHKKHFEIMQQKLPELDQGFSALLGDLADRGLLESTIVWWGGEFGRGPKVDWESPWNGGRSHYGQCFTSVLAGGGFEGGRVLGASDERGLNVADRPVYPRDLIGSVYQQMGIDPEAPLENERGLDVQVLPEKEEGAKSAGLLKEIMS